MAHFIIHCIDQRQFSGSSLAFIAPSHIRLAYSYCTCDAFLIISLIHQYIVLLQYVSSLILRYETIRLFDDVDCQEIINQTNRTCEISRIICSALWVLSGVVHSQQMHCKHGCMNRPMFCRSSDIIYFIM